MLYFDSENEMNCFGAEKVTGRAAIERESFGYVKK
jgi:hypothetical protein